MPQQPAKLHWGWRAALVLALCAPLAAFWLAKAPQRPSPAPEAAQQPAVQAASQPASAASAAASATLPPVSGDPLAAAEAMALVSARSSQMVLAAVQFLGTPYRWGGKTQSGGFDCSGVVRAVVLRATGMELPMSAREQAWVTRPVPQHELRAGDLVFFNTRGHVYSHVGIYVGDGFFIHAPHSGAVVRIEDMRQEKWMRRLTGTHRLPLMRPVVPASAAESSMSMASSPASSTVGAAQQH